MFFTRAVISALETLRFMTRVGSDCPQYSKARWVGPILDGLDEPAAEAYSHCAVGQPLRLQLLQVVQQGLQLLYALRRQLVGPLWVRDRSPPRPGREHRRGVVDVEQPLFSAGGVVGEREVDVLRLHFQPQHEPTLPTTPAFPVFFSLNKCATGGNAARCRGRPHRGG
jgi:hypothetical protein